MNAATVQTAQLVVALDRADDRGHVTWIIVTPDADLGFDGDGETEVDSGTVITDEDEDSFNTALRADVTASGWTVGPFTVDISNTLTATVTR